MEPLYSLRYACGPQMPSEITVGTEMCSIQRLTDYILPQELYAKGCVMIWQPSAYRVASVQPALCTWSRGGQ